jgi:plasmid stabilization system protein ParE
MELITSEQAVEFGLTLKDSLDSLAKTSEIERLHGDTVASLHRIASLQRFKQNLNSEVAKALILSGAGTSYEVAESANYKIPDVAKLEGAVRAMQAGYLLSDEAGPHFALIMGKGGVSVLIKESGHRHKLKRRGAKSVDVKATANHMRPRPNASGKFDMVIHGEASCVLDGEVITVTRKDDFPIILPCYETDGPDGHEAKARRRLLRDLWAKVSGDFEPIELDEVESESQVEQIVVPVRAIDRKPLTDTQGDETEKHNPTLARIRKILSDNPDQLTFVESVWNEIAAAKTQDKLEEAGKELAAMKASVSQQVLSLVRPFYQARQSELKGGVA